MTKTLLGIAIAVVVAGGLGFGLSRLQRPAAGPVEPVWDFERCAHCRMHLAERRYAAQFQPDNGEPVFFDDPGCLLLWRAESGLDGRAYYRHAQEERWIAEPDAVFVSARQTPMGWGFAVVDEIAGGRESGDRRWSPEEALAALEESRMRSESVQ